MYVCIYVCMYVSMYLCIYMYTCRHTKRAPGVSSGVHPARLDETPLSLGIIMRACGQGYTLRVSHQHCRQACLTQRRCPRQSPLLRCFGFVTCFCPAAGVERACRCPGPSAWPPRRPASMLVPMCVYRHVYVYIGHMPIYRHMARRPASMLVPMCVYRHV